MSETWAAVLVLAAGAYLLKLAGWLLPAAVFESRRVRRGALLLPVALLAALVVVQTFTDGRALVLDARAAGLAAGAVAVALRAPFLVLVGVAAATAALVRTLT
ncbi:MAG TPA: AzlD domain-containing protein [Mycobacteriales bacterium]|nr:AzlD domain-containing protein [Mycobacteriales bacterium]